jgi:hypothetical protein
MTRFLFLDLATIHAPHIWQRFSRSHPFLMEAIKPQTGSCGHERVAYQLNRFDSGHQA